MKVSRTISKTSIQLVIGLILGTFVISQSTLYSVNAQAEEVKKEQKSDEGDKEQYLTLTNAIPSTPTQINLNYQSFLLEELYREEENESTNKTIRFDIPLGKALKVLFRQIISPNAP